LDLRWNDKKAVRNKQKHRVSFEEARRFDFDNALIVVDDVMDYGEERLVGIGFIGLSVFVIVFTEETDFRRVISLRRANRKEIERYGEYVEKGW
jgi:uncharacterized DUF497 family protein